MVGKSREERQAAIAAARARNSAPLDGKASKAKSKDTTVAGSDKDNGALSRFRRSRSRTRNTKAEERHDEFSDNAIRLNRSSSRERIEPPAALARPRSYRTSRSKSRERSFSGALTADSSSLFGAGDKRQKKIIYKKFSDDASEVIEIVVGEPPRPASPSHIVVKISASTVSYNDCLIRRGICFDVINPTDLPTTPGMDVVGVIVSVGKKVTMFKEGDRVATLVRIGGNARYICVPAGDAISVPKSCDSAEAVCMVSTYMTAYQALRMVTKDNFTLNEKRVLITGGIEPVGQALIQLCFRAGAEEIYATAPNHRHRYIKTVLGARPLPVDPKLWLENIKGSMDVVFDGTCYDSLASPCASLKSDGVLVCVGMSALLNKEKPGILNAPLAAYWARLKGQILSNTKSYEVWESFLENKDAYKLDLEILFHLLKKRFIKPHIAKRIALSEVAEAQASLEQENARGEIVCLPWKRISK